MTENIMPLNCNAMIDEGGGGGGGGDTGIGGNIDRNPRTNNNNNNNKINCDKNSTKQSVADKILIHMSLSFREICIVTAALPLITLFVCFITAYVFQSEEVHETHCRVYNIIPSISAITGVSPQRYFWRICIALHIGPRFMIAACYRRYYEMLLKRRINRVIDELKYKKIYLLLRIVFVLHLIEISALCGVTYVSNRENYPIHEKIFIIFMTCSLCHMLATIKLWEMLQSNASPYSSSYSSSNTETDQCPQIISDLERYSLKLKKSLFYLSIASTIALIIFFLKHRLLCHDMAFSWFALSEYVIATANMLFHCTTMLDFPNERMIILNTGDDDENNQNLTKITTNNSNNNNNNNNENTNKKIS